MARPSRRIGNWTLALIALAAIISIWIVISEGSFVERKGGRWKVVQVNVEMSVAEPFEVPVHRVFLTNKL